MNFHGTNWLAQWALFALLAGLLACAPKRPAVRVLADSSIGADVQALVEAFSAETGYEVELVVRQPALLAQQIRLGYPFDVLVLSDSLLLAQYALAPLLRTPQVLYTDFLVLATKTNKPTTGSANCTVAIGPSDNPLGERSRVWLPKIAAQGCVVVPVLLDEQLPAYARAGLASYVVVYQSTAQRFGLTAIARDSSQNATVVALAAQSRAAWGQAEAAAQLLGYIFQQKAQFGLAKVVTHP